MLHAFLFQIFLLFYLTIFVIGIIAILFYIPFAILLFLYLQALFCKFYLEYSKNPCLDLARRIIAKSWLLHARFWHGYEISGLENVPIGKPSMIVLFHGTVPVDLYYLITLLALDPNRKTSMIGDKFLFSLPGFSPMMRLLNVHPGTIESCCAELAEGKTLLVSPGGAREAVFTDDNYTLLWKQRSGFAKIALAQNVPVIPAFTQNIREGYRTATFGLGKYFRQFYEHYRLPLIPLYGGFPVKLITHFGAPIYPEQVLGTAHYDAKNSQTIDAFITACSTSLQTLIRQKQRLPGSIWFGLWERFSLPHPFAKIDLSNFFITQSKNDDVDNFNHQNRNKSKKCSEIKNDHKNYIENVEKALHNHDITNQPRSTETHQEEIGDWEKIGVSF